jgi:enoyl-CoA hydratase/carnithine racemase
MRLHDVIGLEERIGGAMTLDRIRLETSGSVVRIQIGPEEGGPEDASALRSAWAELDRDDQIQAALVIIPERIADPSRTEFSEHADGRAHLLAVLGPKMNCFFKPFGVGIIGDAVDEVLQLVSDADVVVAAQGSSFSDTSVSRGAWPLHSFLLDTMIPRAEIMRIALGGAPLRMSSERAAQLGLVDVVVSPDDVEQELGRRVSRLYHAGPTVTGGTA